ncbi:peptidyl-prolyl cis-trans isomerase [Aestuariivivens sediminicola]|uniref:peptidyl-prolyl cis-trans isomerase n=1 Tax=Aestuariivivens sediminicola TaxID=2913560 RepID=UPI001F588692|nr:peptidyl-prolyl cis-trans isomerase [Aestuariivivens sediminicola]
MRSRIWILLLFGILVSCSFFKKTDDRDAIARVNDSYLYVDDLKGLISSEISKEDSTLLVQNYITSWATQQLLFDGAKLNLSESKQESFNRLVDQYKNDLYAKAYLEGLVSRNVDTVVTFEEAEVYYNENKTIFKLNEELIKFRYIQVEEQINNFSSIEKRFKRFNNEDKKELDSISIQFKSYSLNDSIWVKVSQVIDKISILNSGNKSELLKKSNFIQLKDSLGVYLMKINDVLLRNETAPIEYVKPTIDQIVINKRKLELIKEIEKDITKDAIKNKQFEIFK